MVIGYMESIAQLVQRQTNDWENHGSRPRVSHFFFLLLFIFFLLLFFIFFSSLFFEYPSHAHFISFFFFFVDFFVSISSFSFRVRVSEESG